MRFFGVVSVPLLLAIFLLPSQHAVDNLKLSVSRVGEQGKQRAREEKTGREGKRDKGSDFFSARFAFLSFLSLSPS